MKIFQPNTTTNLNPLKMNCPKHPNNSVRFICSSEKCTYGNFICEACASADPQHTNLHKQYIFSFSDFVSDQNNPKLQNKLIPSIVQMMNNNEKRLLEYSTHCDNEVQEMEKDFAALFKIFFQISENAKSFIKDHIKNDIKKMNDKQAALKKMFKDISNDREAKKKNDSLLSFFQKDSDCVEASSVEELVTKLITKNTGLNKVRADSLSLNSELDVVISNKIKYKKNDQSKKLYDEIKDNFEKSCKEMYRQFKMMIEGGDQNDLRKSIFTNNMKKSMQPTQTITIDLSKSQMLNSSSSTGSLKNSIASFEKEMQPSGRTSLKKIDRIPEITNSRVLQAIQNYGPLNFKTEESTFNAFPDQGPFEYSDKSVYYGHMKEGVKRHGRGKMIFYDGAFYEGYWKDDIPYGFARFIRSNGDLYEGMCLNFKANGKGTFITLSGDKYIGDWLDDKKHGQGEESWSNGFYYKGSYVNGDFEGQGTLRFPDGTIYTGDFRNNEICGQGKYQYSSGEIYLGILQNGKKEGNGIYIWTDGRKYEGTFLNDVANGSGVFWWPDGLMYSGTWENGQQHGFGIELSEDGAYEKKGEWNRGVWVRWLN